jgi:hypothetical protein
MIRWTKAVSLGFLSWVVPFAISFAVFPIKRSNPALFDTIMALVLVLCAAWLADWCFRHEPLRAGVAALVGMVWAAMNLILDYPMFAYGPMQMSVAQYFGDIGATYLIYPVFTFALAKAAKA